MLKNNEFVTGKRPHWYHTHQACHGGSPSEVLKNLVGNFLALSSRPQKVQSPKMTDFDVEDHAEYILNRLPVATHDIVIIVNQA